VRELLEQPTVGAFELARAAAPLVDPLLGHDRDRLSGEHDRDRHQTGLVLAARGRFELLVGDLARLEGGDDHGQLVARARRAHEVGGVHRLGRCRPDLGDHAPVAGSGGHVQEQVGEGEIGEHPPFGHEAVEVRHLVAIEDGVLTGELGQLGHTASLPHQRPARGHSVAWHTITS
jgi:hypothetical protein